MSIEPPDTDPLPEISWKAQDGIESWCRILDQTKGDKRPIFERACVELLRLAESHADPAARQAIIDALYDIAMARGIGPDETQAIMGTAHDALNGFALNGIEPLLLRNEPTPAPIQWLDMSTWDDSDPPPLRYAIPDCVPAEQAGLSSGVGGTGKTTTELMKDVAHVLHMPWYGFMPIQGPAIYVGTEDPDPVLRIRLTAVARYYNATFADLIGGGLHLWNLYGKDATLFHFNTRTQRVETTPLYRQLYQAAGDLKPINISLDPLARIFSGNEIDRTHVYGLVGHAQALAMVSGGSVTILSHPSLQGISSGSGISGSTAWHDAFRFRQYLKKGKEDDGNDTADTGLRELAFMKNQYGPPVASIALRYQRGLFLPVSSTSTLEKLAAEQAADNLFLELLDKFQSQGRNVSHHKNANSYAPTMFCKDPKAKAPGMHKALADAMERLFTAKKIKVENYGKPSNPHYRIVRCCDQKKE